MEKLLTIIVPTFNMEMYLDKCLTSLIVGEPDCEMMRGLEVLVINDGSTDKSSEIAHDYEKRFPDTFRVVDKENGNYGSCINVALPLATGKYVKILDADDWFDTEVFKEYLTWLKDIDVDAVFTDFFWVKNGKNCLNRAVEVEPYCSLPFCDYCAQMQSLFMYCVTYNRRIFKGLGYRQSEGIFYTDTEWTFLPLSAVKIFIYYPKALYCYLVGRPGQTMAPAVHNVNLPMRAEVAFSCLKVYETCFLQEGKCNGIEVNLEFMYLASFYRLSKVYLFVLTMMKNPSQEEFLKKVDQQVLKDYPRFYEKLDCLLYPDTILFFPCLRFRIVHFWRKYGWKIVKKQVEFINHYLGLLNRWSKLKQKLLNNHI